MASNTTRQRSYAFVAAVIAAAVVLIAFVAAKAAQCDERQVGAICLAAGLLGLGLAAAVIR